MRKPNLSETQTVTILLEAKKIHYRVPAKKIRLARRHFWLRILAMVPTVNQMRSVRLKE
ncbi:MAG: hypothetical protein R3F19_13135 [Verrucomicrobiales bacterium]